MFRTLCFAGLWLVASHAVAQDAHQRVSRYSMVHDSAPADLLATRLLVTFPSSIQTVGGALGHVFDSIGYQYKGPAPAVWPRPLPNAHRQLAGPADQLVQTLAGPAYQLIRNDTDRTVQLRQVDYTISPNPLLVPAFVALPESTRTVGAAFDALLSPHRYRLLTELPAPTDSLAIASEPLTPAMRSKVQGWMTTKDALISLLPVDVVLLIDRKSKRVSVTRQHTLSAN